MRRNLLGREDTTDISNPCRACGSVSGIWPASHKGAATKVRPASGPPKRPAYWFFRSRAVRSRQRHAFSMSSSICARSITNGGAMTIVSRTARITSPLEKQ